MAPTSVKELYLGLAIHNHQPVGNFPWVFEEAWQKAYLPFLEALESHPSVRLSLHYSGPLLDWLREHQPPFLDRLGALVKRGQVEMMTGGYYEPILPIIPDADKVGQIQKMNHFIQERFGARPSGLWLAERVWEPHLAKPLAEAGVGWTVVDDTHFHLSGLRDDQLLGYYITEELGSWLKVFPSSKRLRYLIPWKKVEEVMTFLQGLAAEGPRIAVMGDDGEKFGVWPRTYQHCWQKGWMKKFLEAVEANASWLHTIPLGEYAQRFPPLGRVYLPTASYDEMMEWALPPEASRELTLLRHEMEAQRPEVNRYLRGGFWRNFLAKYPEADILHKKMLRVHHKVYGALGRGETDAGLEELWHAQCNCPYWHGVFGGLYLNDVRSANYHYLILAENKADASRGRGWLSIEEVDLDLDGRPELLVEGEAQCLYVDPSQGGGLFLWDLRRQAHNLQGTVARHPEAYHSMALAQPAPGEEAQTIHGAVLVKDTSILSRFPYDWHPRWSLLEHFIPPGLSLEEYAEACYQDLGDFTLNPFQARYQEQALGLHLRLERLGKLRDRPDSLRLSKELFIPRGRAGLEVTYELTSLQKRPVSTVFVSEWNLNLLGGGKNPAAYYHISGVELRDRALDSQGELEGVREVALVNEHLGIHLTLEMDRPARLWRFPVESISNSEGGLERVYQASCLALLYPVKLIPSQPFRIRLSWRAT